MSFRKQKMKNIELLNSRLLREEHVHTDEGKINYIKGALKNLNSSDLDKIYDLVEKYDPEYEGKEEK
jgi:hypothetical protein